MDDESHPHAHIQSLEQSVEIAALFDETVRAGATVRQLVRVSHADQIGSDTAAEWFQVRYYVAPEERRRGIAMQEHDWVTLSHFNVRHLAVEDFPLLLWVPRCRRDCVGFFFFLDHGDFSFFLKSHALVRAPNLPQRRSRGP